MAKSLITAILIILLFNSVTVGATPEEVLQWLDEGVRGHNPDNEWNRYWIETYQAAKMLGMTREDWINLYGYGVK